MWYFLFLYRILELFSHFNKKLTGIATFTSSILFIQIKLIKHKNKKQNKKQTNKQTHKAQNTKTINMQMNKTTTTTNNKQRKNNQN
jgi:quinol-cytochrome oxidoreductase complex cytochrome b subunit